MIVIQVILIQFTYLTIIYWTCRSVEMPTYTYNAIKRGPKHVFFKHIVGAFWDDIFINIEVNSDS